MNLLTLLAGIVFAVEATVLSPLASDWQPLEQIVNLPTTTFGQITSLLPEPEVLGEQTSLSNNAAPTPTSKPVRTTRQKSYTIALLGDSMIDTLGKDAANLAGRLNSVYPRTDFTIQNYGVGGTNIDYGLARVTGDYDYVDSHIPALASQSPDVVVIESFGYNPFVQSDDYLTRHWLALAHVIDALRLHIPGVKLVIAATIAPNAEVFGDGVLNWTSEQKHQKVATIKEYLKNAVKFARSQKLPLADAYHASLGSNGNGKLMYINPGDHIHYSEAGMALMAQKIAETIAANRLLE
ncbi:SGNH/GDSL hydrolase family protein [Patescibacteria group bacterium]|nr:SGNH/GDSL hydrolase family protein [Patescibacteria group bacterium]MBU1472618.1 SGNH/GDSL hydrolase family protein [Patescibacteria group bacterium]MBU2459612.1 SGNH/GDSL hydrolase family protein [Patescibacteria group bacterium]MBU2544070.1 SGNH/GDSL hydrolase family protein [Patescibacteria group bacterium]